MVFHRILDFNTGLDFNPAPFFARSPAKKTPAEAGANKFIFKRKERLTCAMPSSAVSVHIRKPVS